VTNSQCSYRSSSRLYIQEAIVNKHIFRLCAALSLAGALLTACNYAAGSKLERANYDQIHEKMSKEQVQAILGPPTSTSTEDKVIYKRTTWRYTRGDKYINITFKNDELDSKDTNLGTQ
jgi:outer membrane protein assembly factor BamE (lipoprotein component of BamABCDE complex)